MLTAKEARVLTNSARAGLVQQQLNNVPHILDDIAATIEDATVNAYNGVSFTLPYRCDTAVVAAIMTRLVGRGYRVACDHTSLSDVIHINWGV